MKKIIISGGQGSLAKKIIFNNKNYNIFALNKHLMDITKYTSILKKIKSIKPDYFIHAAALSSPMKQHEVNPIKSIDINIIGTCNVVKACKVTNTKLIYISTNFVYAGTKGNYKETDDLNPINLYAWSKLGGECAVRFYKNSLILRTCMTKKPFPHVYAYTDYITNFLNNDEIAKLILKLINKKGIINLGGIVQTPYQYALKENKNIKKKKFPKSQIKNLGLNTSLNISRLKKLL
jgi:dTDP-4-dehydrorhamnose reductase